MFHPASGAYHIFLFLFPSWLPPRWIPQRGNPRVNSRTEVHTPSQELPLHLIYPSHFILHDCIMFQPEEKKSYSLFSRIEVIPTFSPIAATIQSRPDICKISLDPTSPHKAASQVLWALSFKNKTEVIFWDYAGTKTNIIPGELIMCIIGLFIFFFGI